MKRFTLAKGEIPIGGTAHQSKFQQGQQKKKDASEDSGREMSGA